MQNAQQQSILDTVDQYIANKQLAHAIATLNRALQQTPTFYQGWLTLSRCLFDANYTAKAIDVAKHAEQFDPLNEEFASIQQFMSQNAFAQAAQVADAMLVKCPHHPRALFTLASINLSQQLPERSALLLEKELPFVPAVKTLRQLLIDSYLNAGDYQKALDAARDLVELAPSFESIWQWIGLLFKYAQYQGVLQACDRAEEFAAQSPAKLSQIELMRGQTLRIMGQRQNSIDTLRRSLRHDPSNADAWWALADFKNYQFSGTEYDQLHSLANDKSVDQRSKMLSTFCLAKSSEIKDGLELSFSLYERANQLFAKPFSSQEMQQEFAARIRGYSEAALATQARVPNNQPTPIFLVGMPRSGSTLLEQILATHPKIEGTIEQPTLPAIERLTQQICQQKYQSNLLNGLSSLTQDDLTFLGEQYLSKSRLFRQENVNFFIDKQPFNYRLIGLIHKILPHAIIIDVRRNPMDCGLSLFKQYFHSGVEFSYSLDAIADAINAYNAIINHWQTALPERIITVQYETLVSQPENHLQHLFDQMGVSYDERCLQFHKNPRTIHTASSEQVREPLHLRSVNASERVAKSLKVLQQKLTA